MAIAISGIPMLTGDEALAFRVSIMGFLADKTVFSPLTEY